MESEFDLFREKNASLIIKIIRFEFEKVKLKTKNVKFGKRLIKLKKKQLPYKKSDTIFQYTQYKVYCFTVYMCKKPYKNSM
jgi:hypothetical protein